jgi:Protein of unknown function (DUF3237)
VVGAVPEGVQLVTDPLEGAEAVSDQAGPSTPRLELLARFTVELTRPVWELGRTSDLGARRIIPITGGRFAGPRLTGEILDNGADWQIVTADGAAIVDTRYLLRLDDGALAYLRTHGYRHGPPEVLASIARGDDVDPAEYYFRMQMEFETASTAYGWLNRSIVIGSAMRLAQAVVYDAYLVS